MRPSFERAWADYRLGGGLRALHDLKTPDLGQKLIIGRQAFNLLANFPDEPAFWKL